MKSALPKSESAGVEFKRELSDTFEKGVVAFLDPSSVCAVSSVVKTLITTKGTKNTKEFIAT